MCVPASNCGDDFTEYIPSDGIMAGKTMVKKENSEFGCYFGGVLGEYCYISNDCDDSKGFKCGYW